MSAIRSGALRIAAHPVLAFWVFFALFPFIVPNRTMATQVLIYGLLAMGFNLLYGYTGLLSFGHAAYYGLGAYGAGIALAKLDVGSLWLGLAAGLLLAGLGGVVIGFFCLRRRGIYFAMLTLAFAQLLYFIAFHLADWTGGDDGLRGIPQLTLGLGPWQYSIETTLGFYYFAYVLVGLAVVALKRILDSPFGAVLRAIRENTEPRDRLRLQRQPRQAPVLRLLRLLRRAGRIARRAAAHRRAGRVAVLDHFGPDGDDDAAGRRRDLLRSLRRRGHVPRPGGAAEPRHGGVADRDRRHLLRVRPVPPQGDLGHAHRRHPWPSKCSSSTITASASGPPPRRSKKACEFYHDVLGLDPDQGRPTIPTIDGYWMDVGGTAQIHLMGVDGQSKFAQGPGQDPSRPHVALAVADIQEAKERAGAPGRRVTGWPRAWSGPQSQQIFMNDPFGNMIELHQVDTCRCVDRPRRPSAACARRR